MLAMSNASPNATLSSLFQGIVDIPREQDRVITGIELDSRNVHSGGLFIALPGTRSHGTLYMRDAIQRGAVAVVVDASVELPEIQQTAEDVVAVVRVPDTARVAGVIASRFYHDPSRDMHVTGVTGTNGKTSCCVILAQCHNMLGDKASVIGTIGNGLWGELTASSHTTPDAVQLQKMISEFRVSGSDHLLMEVSSHGLEQGRVDGTKINIAVFTNLSQDHLDYHGSMQSYAAAKARLFHDYKLDTAIINVDDDFGRELTAGSLSAKHVIRYGLAAGDVHAENLVLDESGIRMDIVTPWGNLQVKSGLMGRFNVSNLLACAAALLAEGFNRQAVARALSSSTSAPGRMECFYRRGATIVVDYAHTPDALEQALLALRDHVPVHRLICVFGCGGERDRGKRPRMGKIAEQYADLVIITDDNPRHEDAAAIRKQIIGGMRSPTREVANRRQAIKTAIEDALPGDIILVAGKGHETTQQIGDMKFPFSDRQVVMELLEGLE
jgi:UDP-N-acetylmuramoyl-L-alanyl-D-glutamate--2,6-diaminopimelate ligase